MSEPAGGDRPNISLHRRITESLTHRIVSGKLKPGQRLASERKIAETYGASRATVRTALLNLEQAGLITRRKRRSSIVSIQRQHKASIRIACGSSRLVWLFRRLGEMQMLPAHHQLQFVDLTQPGAFNQVISQPAVTADVLVCDLEYVNCFRANRHSYQSISRTEFSPLSFSPVIHDHFMEGKNYIAVPLGLSAQVLYLNRSHLKRVGVSQQWDDDWPVFEEAVRCLTTNGYYGLQMRPSFSHLSGLMRSRGGSLYQANGRIAAGHGPVFEGTVRMLSQFLHVDKSIPILAKAEQINLFAEGRCAMALDGYESYRLYRDRLTENLVMGRLPRADGSSTVVSGFAAVVMPGLENTQTALDFIHALLSPSTQKVLCQLSGALPIRTDLLNLKTLWELGIGSQAAQFLLGELQQCRSIALPKEPEHKYAVENLFLELWLGLDSIDNIYRRFCGL